jgi:hypothetical protein
MTLSITTFSIMTLSITTFRIMTLSITTFSIMTLNITKFNRKGLFGTLSITNTQHVSSVIMLSATIYLTLC